MSLLMLQATDWVTTGLRPWRVRDAERPRMPLGATAMVFRVRHSAVDFHPRYTHTFYFYWGLGRGWLREPVTSNPGKAVDPWLLHRHICGLTSFNQRVRSSPNPG